MSDVTAAQLKNEGNELFRKQDYSGALVKYSEALALDDKNAVLYANRAACSHGLHNYLDAMDDAKMATELDPGYAKGWSRLATVQDALAEWEQSAITWQRALDALPAANLSQTERQQKDQYAASLKAAKALIEELGKDPIFPLFKMNEKDGKSPWQVAAEMLPELRRTASAINHENLTSSAWMISTAYEDFTTGVNMMKDLKLVPRPQVPGGFVFRGRLDALTLITNGMIRDDRACHVNEPDWVDMYNKQVTFEVTACRVWDSERPEAVKEQAQTRLRENGWDDVRPALSVTVCGWIMRASWDGNIRHGHQAGVQYFKRALDLLEWGRAIWKDVSKNDRGVIFEDSFVTGVRALYLKMLLKAYSTDPGLNSKFSLEDLKEEAEELLRETNRIFRNPTKDVVNPGFVLSLISYHAGVAHSTLGVYHVQMAKYGSDPLESMYSFMKGAAAYMNAANKYPEDDESRALYLNCTLDCLRNAGVCIGDFNQVAIRLREAAPKMMKIWALSALAQAGRDTRIRANLDSAEDIMKLVAEGKLTLDDRVPLS